MQLKNAIKIAGFSIRYRHVNLSVLFVTAFLFVLSSITLCHAQSYIKCWKNDQGLTECGNRIPREYYSKEIRFIDTQGITRKVKQREKTREEQAVEKEKQRILQAQMAHEKDLQEYDDILLKTYLTVDDLLSALDSKIDILDSRTAVLESVITARKKKFDQLVKRAADIERSGKTLPEKFQHKLNLARSELHNLQSQFDREQQDAVKIQRTYSHDVERFMITSATRIHYSLSNPGIARKLNAVRMTCRSEKQCRSYWKKAKHYIQQYSTTAIRYSSNHIVVTDSPLEPHAIAMGLTLLDKKELKQEKGDNYIIFQLRCHKGREGQQYCKGDNISNILREFKSEMFY